MSDRPTCLEREGAIKDALRFLISGTTQPAEIGARVLILAAAAGLDVRQVDIARALNLSEGRISQKVRKIRAKFADLHSPVPIEVKVASKLLDRD
jgi:hypothetical protein